MALWTTSTENAFVLLLLQSVCSLLFLLFSVGVGDGSLFLSGIIHTGDNPYWQWFAVVGILAAFSCIVMRLSCLAQAGVLVWFFRGLGVPHELLLAFTDQLFLPAGYRKMLRRDMERFLRKK